MTQAISELILALAVRPEILGNVAIAGVLAIMFRRRAQTPAKHRESGNPVFKLMINRLTQVMLVLAGATVLRELGFILVAAIKAGG